jgi:hypothetical protein
VRRNHVVVHSQIVVAPNVSPPPGFTDPVGALMVSLRL